MHTFKKLISLPAIATAIVTTLVIMPTQVASAKGYDKGEYVQVKNDRQHGQSRHHKSRHYSNNRHNKSRHNKHGNYSRSGHHNNKHRNHNRHNNHYSGNHNKSRHHGRHSNHNRYSFNIGYGYGNNYGYGKNYNRGYSGNSYGSSHNGKNNCRSTYKYKYDRHGNKTRVNGTMCYDNYGKSYIVPGSRYVANNYR